MEQPVKNILVIQTAFIGDVIMTTPLFAGIRKVYPQAGIDVVVNSKHTQLLDNNPHIRRVLGFNKSGRKILNLLMLIRSIRRENYDLALSMQIHLSSSLMMFLGGIPRRIGSARQRMLTRPVVFPKGLHIRKRAVMLLRELKEDDYDLQTRLYPSQEDHQQASQFLKKSEGFRIGIAPGSVWETKKWPMANYVEVIAGLPDHMSVYLIGGGKEDELLCEEIVRQNPGRTIINTAGKLSLLQSAALIGQLDLVLCNDSAPLHMANAMETPVFGIFGPTVKRFGCYPYRVDDKMIEIDLYCRPCSKHGGKVCPEGHFRCMKDIAPSRVLSEITNFAGKQAT